MGTVIMTGKKVLNFTFNRKTKLLVSSFIINRRPRSGRRLYLNPRKDWRINPKKSTKKNQNKITFIYSPYYTITQLLHWTGESTQKNQPKKIKIKSPLSIHPTKQLCNFYIGLENQPKKNQPKKIKKKS